MAKKTMSMSFKSAEISLEDMSITEFTKDGEETFDLMSILKQWDGIQGISMTIKQENGLSPTLSEDGE